MMNASGDSTSPFSHFVDPSKFPKDWSLRRASPSTVTKVGVLPLGNGKKGVKAFLRERQFPPSHDIRCVLYKSLCKRISHNSAMFSEEMYKDFIEKSFPKVTCSTEIPLPSFVASSDEIPLYLLNEDGQFELRRILLCINHHFPHIVYCTILPPIISLLLHYDDSPSQVFSHACHLMFSNVRSIHYIDQSEMEAEISADILKEFVRKFAATSHKALTGFTDRPNNIYSQWIRVLFSGLPFSYLVVLFDMYLVDGYKALFRVAIAVLKYYKRLGSSNPDDIIKAVFDFVCGLNSKISVSLLFRKAYGIKLPSTKDIRKLYQKRLISEHYAPSLTKRLTPERSASWRFIYLVRNVPSNILNESLFSKLYCWLPQRISTLRPVKIFSTEKSGYSVETLFQSSDDRAPTILLIKTTSDYIIGAYLSSGWSDRSSKSFFGTGETFLFTLSPEIKMYPWVESAENVYSRGTGVCSDGGTSVCSSHISDVRWHSTTTRTNHGVTLPHIRLDSGKASLTSSNRESRENFVLPPIVSSPGLQDASPSPSVVNPTDSRSSVLVQPIHCTESRKFKPSSEMFMYADDSGIVVGGGNGYGLFLDKTFLNCSTARCDTFANDPLVPGEKFVCACVEVFGFTD